MFCMVLIVILPFMAPAQDSSAASQAAGSEAPVELQSNPALPVELPPPGAGVQATGVQATDTQTADTQAAGAQATGVQATGAQAADTQPAGAQATGVQAADTQAAAEDDSQDSLTEEIQEELAQGTMHLALAVRLGIAGAIVFLQIILIYAVHLLFKWFAARVSSYGETHFKPFKIKKIQLVHPRQIISICNFFIKIMHYVVMIFQFYLTIPMIFSQFEPTRNLASTLFSWILTPLKRFAFDIFNYIPNLITILLIVLIMRYILRALKFFTGQIQKGKLLIPGFYADWARPTYNILRALLYAFTIAIVYPYLPGSDSAVFQGVSVFIGIIFSLGSSSAIGNLVAGMVITYMRPFKIGDRIKINDTTGFVIEKSPIVVRVKTHKNEYVTFPNMMVLTSSIVNYHTSSSEDEEGLIIHVEMTMGYAVPWPQVHELLIAAALKTAHIQQTPKPYVLQTALDDYYCRYQINAYTRDVDMIPAIYSELRQNIQDYFKEAGISLTAPAYQIRLPPEPPIKQGENF
jgi:small-conductance mechanosensitive channel